MGLLFEQHDRCLLTDNLGADVVAAAYCKFPAVAMPDIASAAAPEWI